MLHVWQRSVETAQKHVQAWKTRTDWIVKSHLIDEFHEFTVKIFVCLNVQESPAIADKPAQRESLPKIAPIRRAYTVVADNTGLSSIV